MLPTPTPIPPFPPVDAPPVINRLSASDQVQVGTCVWVSWELGGGTTYARLLRNGQLYGDNVQSVNNIAAYSGNGNGDCATSAAGVALYVTAQTRQAQQLAADLQHARERLVAAREEERRRLRRDLHDGLGPALASLTLKVDAARDELNYDTGSAAAMLTEVKGDIRAAVGDIRRLVYDLRPPALDDLGLTTSLCLLAERYQIPGLTIICDLPERLPLLPAAVEVAIYRIVAEALTNVVRHAGARTCRVRLAVAEWVELDISDDGRGLPPDAVADVGLLSMRERAAELGGECAVTSGPGAGTTVQVWLPLP